MSTLFRNRLFFLVLVSYVAYAIAFIFSTSNVINGERYFTLFDDGMISMQYAKNLAHGFGLVWNVGGEHVEGYTNLLWVLYMAVMHLLPISASKVGLFVQLTGALLLLLNLVVIAKITDLLSSGSKLAIGIATLLTAFYLPLNNWALQGMEVSALTILVNWSVLLAIRGPSSMQIVLIYLALGIGTLIRIDMVIPLLTTAGTMMLIDSKNRNLHALIGIVTLLLFVGAQTTFRWLYYGDVLPNTYYLKMTGYPTALRIARGLVVFLDFLWRTNPLIFLVTFGFVVTQDDRRLRLLLAIITMQIAYSIYVGGDAWEGWGYCNRYIVIAMPLLFVLLALALVRFQQLFALAMSTSNMMKWLFMPAFVLTILLNLNAVRGLDGWNEWILLSRPLYADANKEKIELGLFLKQITTDRASVAVSWAGATPYFMDRYAIDLLGKSDRVIAHRDMHLPPQNTKGLRFFYPGHLKYDYAYSIGQLKPDVIISDLRDQQEAMPYLAAYKKVTKAGHEFYLLDGSPNILWSKLEAPASG